MTRARFTVAVSLAALLIPAAAAAQGSSWINLTWRSPALGRRTIYVALPHGYTEEPRRRYPVLVCLDADDSTMFRLWIAQAAYVADNDAGVPPVIVVGITNGDDRLHDMTPRPVGSSVAQFPTGGGADAFADFILEEVLPRIRRQYRTLPTTVITGHSAGGLFALDAVATRPGAFQAVIALSPAIWYNDARPALEFAEAIAKSTARLRVFVDDGGVDEPDIDSATHRFTSVLDSLRPAGVAMAYRRYPDETHSLTPLGFADGFRFIFGQVSRVNLPMTTIDLAAADTTAIAAALTASEQAYAAGARDLRLPEQLPERIVNSFGYRLLNHHKESLAIAVFRQNVERYPESVNVHDSYADGLVAAGDTATAVKELREAVAVGRRTGAPVSAETRRKLAKLTTPR